VRVAWFRSKPSDVVQALGQTHEIELFSAANAHDFVWKHFRAPYDVTVFEVGADLGTSWVRTYLFHYPGIAVLSGVIPRAAGAIRAMHHACAHSRLLVTRDAAHASRLADAFPGVPVRCVPLGVGSPDTGVGSGSDPFRLTRQPGAMRLALIGNVRGRDGGDAIRRARALGTAIDLVDDPATADVVLSLAWPADGDSLAPVLDAMRRRQAVMAFEIEATADWPALDPQTWHPRGADGAPPILVSIDPRDEEHSLVLALRRLARDPDLRERLAGNAHAWWRTHATLAREVDAWLEVLDAVASAHAPSSPPWLQDGTAGARAVLNEFGVTVDFLN
jgi:hypothetical protein